MPLFVTIFIALSAIGVGHGIYQQHSTTRRIERLTKCDKPLVAKVYNGHVVCEHPFDGQDDKLCLEYLDGKLTIEQFAKWAAVDVGYEDVNVDQFCKAITTGRRSQ